MVWSEMHHFDGITLSQATNTVSEDPYHKCHKNNPSTNSSPDQDGRSKDDPDEFVTVSLNRASIPDCRAGDRHRGIWTVPCTDDYGTYSTRKGKLSYRHSCNQNGTGKLDAAGGGRNSKNSDCADRLNGFAVGKVCKKGDQAGAAAAIRTDQSLLSLKVMTAASYPSSASGVPKKYSRLRWFYRLRNCPRNGSHGPKSVCQIVFCLLLGYSIRTWTQVYQCYKFNRSPLTGQNTCPLSMCQNGGRECRAGFCRLIDRLSVTNGFDVEGEGEVMRMSAQAAARIRRGVLSGRDPYTPLPPLRLDGLLMQRERAKTAQDFEVVRYQYFDDYYLYDTFGNEPRIAMPGYHKEQKSLLTTLLINKMNQLGKSVVQDKWELQKVVNGYAKYEPGYGTHYVLDFRMRRRRRPANNDKGGNTKGKLEFELRRAHLFQPLSHVELIGYSEMTGSVGSVPDNDGVPRVHIVVPIAGKDIEARFDTFLSEFRNVGRLNVKLWIILSAQVTPDETELEINLRVRDFLERDKLRTETVGEVVSYEIEIVPVEGPFSRGGSLHQGAMLAAEGDDALLFFCDADMSLRPAFLERCRENTRAGLSVYYPLVFSQYRPDVVRAFSGTGAVPSLQDINENTGHWVDYGFGLVCLYQSDYLSVGGFDRNISGWGAEDVDLYEKHVRSDIKVFRAMDPDLVHTYHDKYCDRRLNEEQYTMCIDTKSETYGSKRQLGRKILNETYYKKRTMSNLSNMKPEPRSPPKFHHNIIPKSKKFKPAPQKSQYLRNHEKMGESKRKMTGRLNVAKPKLGNANYGTGNKRGTDKGTVMVDKPKLPLSNLKATKTNAKVGSYKSLKFSQKFKGKNVSMTKKPRLKRALTLDELSKLRRKLALRKYS